MENSTAILEKLYSMGVAFAPKFIMALIALIIGFWIIGRVTNLIGAIINRRGLDVTIREFVTSLVNVGLKVLLLLSIAGMFGIETTSFIAIFTALAFAVGSALSGSLGHFASGVLLLVFRPYKVGDLVTVGGQTGNVEGIQVFHTVLRTLDNKKIIIPNGIVTSGVITNISGQGEIRVDMTYNVANSNDIDKVRRVVQDVANACPYVLKSPPVDILVNESQIGITQFAVRPWCKSEHYWDTYFYMQENIVKAFGKNGVAAPVPGMNVNVIKPA